MNAIEFLPEYAWKHPRDYAGFSPDGDYVLATRSGNQRTILEESNWYSMIAGLNVPAEPYDCRETDWTSRPILYTWTASHWAVGYVEYLMLRADAPEELQENAAELLCALADYPILDESDYSDRQWKAMCEYWERDSVRGRMEFCREAGVSLFAARRADVPGRVTEYLLDGEMFA